VESKAAVGGKFPRSNVVALPLITDDAVASSVAFWRLYKSGAIAADLVTVGIVRDPHRDRHGVHQGGEIVGAGAGLSLAVAQRVFDGPSMGHVGHDGHEAPLAAELHRRDRQHRSQVAPAPGPEDRLGASLGPFEHRRYERGALLYRPDAKFRASLSNRFFPTETHDFDERRIHVEERAVRRARDSRRLGAQMENRFESPLRLPQCILGGPAIVNVERRRDPPKRSTARVQERRNLPDVPAIIATTRPNPVLDFSCGSCLECLLPPPRQFRNVVGMNGCQRAFVAERGLLAHARQLEPAIVDPLELPHRVARPYDVRQSVGEYTVQPIRAGARAERSDCRIAIDVTGQRCHHTPESSGGGASARVNAAGNRLGGQPRRADPSQFTTPRTWSASEVPQLAEGPIGGDQRSCRLDLATVSSTPKRTRAWSPSRCCR